MEHEVFTLDSSKCIQYLRDAADKPVTLTWVNERKKHHTLKIKSRGGTYDANGDLAPYSLYNLSLQDRNFDVTLQVLSGRNVTFWRSDLATKIQPTGGAYVIPMTNWVSPQDPKPNEKAICFISFDSNSCQLEIVTKRKLKSEFMPFTGSKEAKTVAKRIAKGGRGNPRLTSHDTIPDPPSSGAES